MTQKKEYIDYCAEQEIKRVYERYETPDFMDYNSFAEVVRYFLNWQMEQMMRKAIPARIVNDEPSGCVVDCDNGCLVMPQNSYNMTDKIKIIIVKEE